MIKFNKVKMIKDFTVHENFMAGKACEFFAELEGKTSVSKSEYATLVEKHLSETPYSVIALELLNNKKGG